MKLNHAMQRRLHGWCSPGSRLVRSLAVGVTLAALGSMLNAWSSPPPRSGTGGDESVDDETVGTLPSTTEDTFDWLRVAQLNLPVLCLEGTLENIQGAILYVHGDAHAVVLPMHNGHVRVALIGRVEVGLDREMFQYGDVQTSLLQPSAVENASLSTQLGRTSRFDDKLLPGYHSLAIPAWEANGMLELAPARMSFSANDHVLVRVQARTIGNVLVLTQAR